VPYRLATGTNRIFYKAKNFKKGLAVTAMWVDSELNLKGPYEFIEIGFGIYYRDSAFLVPGDYAAVILEDGVEALAAFFSVIHLKNRSDRHSVTKLTLEHYEKGESWQ
jgi:hypothetical protein